MDSNHRCLGVDQESWPLDHGIVTKLDIHKDATELRRFTEIRGFFLLDKSELLLQVSLEPLL